MTKKGEKKAKATKAPKAAKAKAAAKSSKKQLDIPGTERKRIPELDDPAEAYRTARNDRQSKTKVEKAKKQELIAAARAALAKEPGDGVKVYRYEGEDGEVFDVEYSRETKENVKVTQVAKAGGDEDSE